MAAAKKVPGRQRRCALCKKVIVFARVMRTESGRGGGWMPFDLEPADNGNFAVRATSPSTGVARALKKDERPDSHEVRAMPHAASCPNRTGRGIGDEAEQWLKDQTQRSEK